MEYYGPFWFIKFAMYFSFTANETILVVNYESDDISRRWILIKLLDPHQPDRWSPDESRQTVVTSVAPLRKHNYRERNKCWSFLMAWGRTRLFASGDYIPITALMTPTTTSQNASQSLPQHPQAAASDWLSVAGWTTLFSVAVMGLYVFNRFEL